jgi:Flp pilus assembly protein TadD
VAGVDDPLKILSLQVTGLDRIRIAGSPDPEVLKEGAAWARFTDPLGENLSWIAEKIEGEEVPLTYPERFEPPAREAIRKRLVVQGAVRALNIRARGLLAHGRTDPALAAAERSLAHDPSDLEGRVLAARALSRRAGQSMARGEDEAASEDYGRALALDSGSVEALTALSWLRYADGDREGAEALLRRGIRSAPWVAILHQRLGLVQLERGEIVEAESSLRRAHRLDPRQPRTLLLLGDVAARRGEVERALDLYRQAIALGGMETEARTSMASLHLEAGSATAASDEIEAALRAKPGDPEALLTRARIRAAGGDRGGARRDLLSAVATGGPTYRARAMLEPPLRNLLDGDGAATGTEER